MADTAPFDDIRDLISKMPAPDNASRDAVIASAQALGNGLSPLGRSAHALAWLASWQSLNCSTVNQPLIAVFAATHGVASHVVDGDILQASAARVKNLTEGGSAVRGIAASCGAAFKVYELGLDYPSADFTQEPSLTERDCAAAIAFGMEVVAEGADVIVLGNAGLGAATAAAGIARGLYGGAAEYWAGGEGQGAKKRIQAVHLGAQRHKDALELPLQALRCFGGRDIAGLVGAILAARHQRIPVILDGYVVCAAAAVLHAIKPSAIDHCLAAHVSREPAHQALLDRIGLTPFLDMEINIGDGTGGAFAMNLLKAAVGGLKTLQDIKN